MDVHAWYEEHKRSLRDEFMREIEPRLADARFQVEVKPLIHLFERRLGRPLSSSERDMLMAQVKAHGSDHVGDIVLDLSVPELAAWLERGEVVGGG
jgi:hypothetical protein